MNVELKDIPGLSLNDQCKHRIKVLAINGKSPALESLIDWQVNQTADFNKILKVIKLVGSQIRVTNPKHVKACVGKRLDGLYEMRADKGHARLVFFYSREDDTAVAVCTNPYWKAKSSKTEQTKAFQHGALLKTIYESSKS